MIINSKDDVEKLSYTDFVSLICEENRPSGGKKTIRCIAQNAFINKDSNVLEIGSTNGFSSLEMHKITNCKIVGIDLNPNSVENANNRIKKNKLDSEKITFQVGNAEKLPFDNESFDLIISGNALSFVENKSTAFEELIRVLKPNGFISIVPIWYKNIPDQDIIEKVNRELGFKIRCTFENDWNDFSDKNLELYYKKDFTFIKASNDEINKYVEKMINSKKILSCYNTEIIQSIKERWNRIITIFNENLSMANYSIILLRKTVEEEELEIFKTKEL